MNIFYTSDIHLDFWILSHLNSEKMIKQIILFTKDVLKISEKRKGILIIAGDLGHCNRQNIMFLEYIENFFDAILYTYGNHELYLLSNSQIKKYENSFKKIEELKKLIEKNCKNTYFLDGDIKNINGINFLGLPLWYDFSYGLKQGYDKEAIYKEWKSTMNDAVKIKGNDDLGYRTLNMGMYSMEMPKYEVYTFDPLKFFKEQKEKLEKNIKKADIVFTHIPPLPVKNLRYSDDFMQNFYSFDGEKFLKENQHIKFWIYGHNHMPYRSKIKLNNIEILANPLGYNDEVDEASFKIKYLSF